MTSLQYGFLVLVALLLPFAIVRWARTPVANPERQARGDVAILLALMLLGQSGSLVRDWVLEKFGVISIGYWTCNLVLLAVAWFAVLILRRLYKAYRHPSPTASNLASSKVSTAAPPPVPPSHPTKDLTPKS